MNYLDALPLHIHRQVLEHCGDLFKDPYTIEIKNDRNYTLYRESDLKYIPEHVKNNPCISFQCSWTIKSDGFVTGIDRPVVGPNKEIFFRGNSAIFIHYLGVGTVYHLTETSNNQLIKHVLDKINATNNKKCCVCENGFEDMFDSYSGFQQIINSGELVCKCATNFGQHLFYHTKCATNFSQCRECSNIACTHCGNQCDCGTYCWKHSCKVKCNSCMKVTACKYKCYVQNDSWYTCPECHGKCDQCDGGITLFPEKCVGCEKVICQNHRNSDHTIDFEGKEYCVKCYDGLVTTCPVCSELVHKSRFKKCKKCRESACEKCIVIAIDNTLKSSNACTNCAEKKEITVYTLKNNATFPIL